MILIKTASLFLSFKNLLNPNKTSADTITIWIVVRLIIPLYIPLFNIAFLKLEITCFLYDVVSFPTKILTNSFKSYFPWKHYFYIIYFY